VPGALAMPLVGVGDDTALSMTLLILGATIAALVVFALARGGSRTSPAPPRSSRGATCSRRSARATTT
jgi:hypothetical protein